MVYRRFKNGRRGRNIWERHRLSRSLGTNATVFQAEIHAIELCVRLGIARGLKDAKIYIVSDSQSALKALRSCTVESRLVWDCLEVIKHLASSNKVTLVWVPGHAGIEGNEAADGLAREGSASPFIGPEPFCGVTKGHLRAAVKRWEDVQKSSYWRRIPGLRQAKRFISPSSARVKECLELRKPELRLLTGFLTGHVPLRYHLKNMGLSTTDGCRFCDMEAESAEHVLCHCPAIFRQRLQHLGGRTMSPDSMSHVPFGSIIGFIKSLNIDWTVI